MDNEQRYYGKTKKGWFDSGAKNRGWSTPVLMSINMRLLEVGEVGDIGEDGLSGAEWGTCMTHGSVS